MAAQGFRRPSVSQHPFIRVKQTTNGTQVSVGGLLGGHSGLMIAEGRGNALVLLVRTLR